MFNLPLTFVLMLQNTLWRETNVFIFDGGIPNISQKRKNNADIEQLKS